MSDAIVALGSLLRQHAHLCGITSANLDAAIEQARAKESATPLLADVGTILRHESTKDRSDIVTPLTEILARCGLADRESLLLRMILCYGIGPICGLDRKGTLWVPLVSESLIPPRYRLGKCQWFRGIFFPLALPFTPIDEVSGSQRTMLADLTLSIQFPELEPCTGPDVGVSDGAPGAVALPSGLAQVWRSDPRAAGDYLRTLPRNRVIDAMFSVTAATAYQSFAMDIAAGLQWDGYIQAPGASVSSYVFLDRASRSWYVSSDSVPLWMSTVGFGEGVGPRIVVSDALVRTANANGTPLCRLWQPNSQRSFEGVRCDQQRAWSWMLDMHSVLRLNTVEMVGHA